ncbi:fructose-1,6-bisphosphatase [Saprolegnia diclina VS20]|uniref:fructose-bisphosphatase n=1 Tax=Saprolegnia diclina (strain VS20) TaxID=1156394 RepID=T0RRF1_SAPDV|nr:fructose-1,6-bisphosphatase [Saprolegnia diclina VS20]EQC32687.1 fructose-1,6-bisphosphatase [Saprolegnia diclina VS20]|eukprot:XP_008613831.1 fructose-1,6-bisphosphatase [Saprolegnia diclina VS20]
MPALGETLTDFLAKASARTPKAILSKVASACIEIHELVQQGALADVIGSAQTDNVQGEVQQKLDILSNDAILNACATEASLGGLCSEEHETFYPGAVAGEYLLLFDPLDGSSNIDVNVSIGTIFSILRRPSTATAVTHAEFLQPGARQVAAGYVIYGPQTILVLSVGDGVHMFTLDTAAKRFVCTRHNVTIAPETKEFAINMSNMRHWDAPVRRYVDECLLGSQGVRGKDFNMRWIASMVTEIHRLLTRGGVFMYPWDARYPEKPGRLRLLYEANPMSFLIEAAGGASINGYERMLDVRPTELHQRVSVILGAKHEIERIAKYHATAAKPNPLARM